MDLFIDTETSGLPKTKHPYDAPGQPAIVEIGLILSDRDKIYMEMDFLVDIRDQAIHPKAEEVHGISKEMTENFGLSSPIAARIFLEALLRTDIIIGHNVSFDLYMFHLLLEQSELSVAHKILDALPTYCTMKETTRICQIPGKWEKYKWPKLTELYLFLFGEEFEGAHRALDDVRATRRCYYRLMEEKMR